MGSRDLLTGAVLSELASSALELLQQEQQQGLLPPAATPGGSSNPPGWNGIGIVIHCLRLAQRACFGLDCFVVHMLWYSRGVGLAMRVGGCGFGT